MIHLFFTSNERGSIYSTNELVQITHSEAGRAIKVSRNVIRVKFKSSGIHIPWTYGTTSILS